MASFRTTSSGVLLSLEPVEAHVLRQVTGELGSVIRGSAGSDDPVEARLFPDAYEDQADEAEYRSMVEDDLRRAKLDALEHVASAVPNDEATDIELDDADVQTWLACLTDIRLAIGTRIGVDEERMSAEPDPDDPDAQTISVMHWLGWIQEGIIRALED